MRKTCLSALLCLMVATGPAVAQTLHFVAAVLPPLVIDNGGKPDGAVLVVLRELTQKLGVPFSVEFLPQPRALLESQKSTDIAFAGVSRNPEREAAYKWVGPLIFDSIVLVTKKGNKAAPATLDAAKTWAVATLRGGATVPALQAAGFTNIVEVKDTESAARMLDAGRVDAWATPKLSGAYIYKSLGLDPKTLEIGPEIRRNDVYLGVPKGLPDDTVATWQKALDELKAQGRIEAITRQFAAGTDK
ncbi:MAG TPA: ABC transporter substrate-binding protein [Telmatospirillum sp.]|nr:ABC transporter substrate-binding protein [Telmatospirillum sp.]